LKYSTITLYDSEKVADVTMIVSAHDTTGEVINAIELKDHPFWIGVQYHPEFKSQPGSPHPLYLGLIKAALEYNSKRRK
jgi:CTP synthase